jgi:hypothetical protein
VAFEKPVLHVIPVLSDSLKYVIVVVVPVVVDVVLVVVELADEDVDVEVFEVVVSPNGVTGVCLMSFGLWCTPRDCAQVPTQS